MASNLKTVRQSLDVARPTRASQAKFRRSTMGGSVQNEQSVQGKLVQPRWNVSTKISSPAKTADQKIQRFRKREEAIPHKSHGVGIRDCSGVPNPGSSLVDLQPRVAPAIVVHEPSAQPQATVDFASTSTDSETEEQAVGPQDGVAPASTGSGIVTKAKVNEPKGFSLEKLRTCVREEAHTDKSSPEFFSNIWRKMGCSVDCLDEVEYWIMMIGIEELEFEHRNNPNRRLISDLPVEILSLIIGNLDPVSRLVTRNASETLRSIVDSQKPNIKCIWLFENPFRILIRFLPEVQDVTFHQKKDWCSVDWRGKKTIVRGGYYVNLALQFLKPLLSNRKLKLEVINVHLNENSSLFQKLFDLMSEVVKTKNTQFHVGNLGIYDYTEEQLDSWLPLFKAGVLHRMDIAVKARRGVVNCLESEQFKGVKSIDLTPSGGLNPYFLNHFLHLETFIVRLQFIPINDILRLMENLSTSNTFKRCEIEVLVYLDLNEIEEAFEVLTADLIKQEGLLYVEVHNVQFSLCFWFQKLRFMIKRKSQNTEICTTPYDYRLF